jgi:hypothetical protein
VEFGNQVDFVGIFNDLFDEADYGGVDGVVVFEET